MAYPVRSGHKVSRDIPAMTEMMAKMVHLDHRDQKARKENLEFKVNKDIPASAAAQEVVENLAASALPVHLGHSVTKGHAVQRVHEARSANEATLDFQVRWDLLAKIVIWRK